MLRRDKQQLIKQWWAVDEKSAYKFVNDTSSISYANYRKAWLTKTTPLKVRKLVIIRDPSIHILTYKLKKEINLR